MKITLNHEPQQIIKMKAPNETPSYQGNMKNSAILNGLAKMS